MIDALIHEEALSFQAFFVVFVYFVDGYFAYRTTTGNHTDTPFAISMAVAVRVPAEPVASDATLVIATELPANTVTGNVSVTALPVAGAPVHVTRCAGEFYAAAPPPIVWITPGALTPAGKLSVNVNALPVPISDSVYVTRSLTCACVGCTDFLISPARSPHLTCKVGRATAEKSSASDEIKYRPL